MFLWTLSGCGGVETGGGNSNESELTLMGTCDYPSEPDSNDEHRLCKEVWRFTTSPSRVTTLRQQFRDSCVNHDDPPGEWTSGETACPTDDGYVGTCEATNEAASVKDHFYAPAKQQEERENCSAEFYVE
jgi:hypothetical protein